MLPDKKYFKNYCESKNIPWREKDVLREYLQTQILKALSSSDYNDAVSFLGGTSLRFIHEIPRFSEDLDFDLVKKDGFNIDALEKDLTKSLSLLGFAIDARTKTTENIYILFIKFKDVLREFELSSMKDEKFLIKFEIDHTPYKATTTETKFIDSFNERFPVLINTLPTLFAQKIIALKLRPYQKGRDFYDIVWFLAQKDIEPNYEILQEKNININNRQELVAELITIISGLDLKQAAKDVERFLFYPEQAKWILELPKYLDGFAKQ
ncbi:MAG: nucleotidyl transferase AbiEii/AbiGii toxin family protein [Parcubacteria group bacterium]|jgi:predicted nucleotidyltransferase component of viral defense system